MVDILGWCGAVRASVAQFAQGIARGGPIIPGEFLLADDDTLLVALSGEQYGVAWLRTRKGGADSLASAYHTEKLLAFACASAFRANGNFA